jgi:hypothetical protein
MKPWLRPRAFLERYSTRFCEALLFLAIEGMDEIMTNKANQQCHFKTYRALDLHVSTGIMMGTVPMTIPIDKYKSSAL